jgi:SAM-dependent methyltransferase
MRQAVHPRSSVSVAPARRLRFTLVTEELERFAAGRPLRVLDAGCGDGAFSGALARRHPDWTVVGVDSDAGLLDRARAAATRNGISNVEFARADLTSDLGDELYDAVAAIESLEEIPEDTEALRRMITALRAGGLLVAHVPERDWKPVLRGSPPSWRHEVRHGYDDAEFAGRLAELGLEDIAVDETCRGLVRLAQELRDRIPARRPALRVVVSSLLAGTVELERAGVTWGQGRALLAHGRRPMT